MDVFDASKVEERKPGTLTNAEAACAWLLDYFKERGDEPVKIRDVETAAQGDAHWYSKGTFERARDMAGVEPLQAGQLKTILGDEYDWLSSEDRPPRAGWVRRPAPQLPK